MLVDFKEGSDRYEKYAQQILSQRLKNDVDSANGKMFILS